MVDLDDKAVELGDSWINGNRKWVLDEIGKSPKYQACYLVCEVMDRLRDHDSSDCHVFRNLLLNRAEP